MLARMISSSTGKKQVLKLVSTRVEAEDIEDILLLKGNIVHKHNVKRGFDIFVSLLTFILILSWLFPLIALIIKVSSQGPVLFYQNREGVNRKVFKCLKFRTMKANSRDVDENGKYLQATLNDNRITSVGAFLRRTSLDELPQFMNVLKGEMSIVGPRPHPIPLNRESEKLIVGYNLRHLVKPGITGLSQVNGYRGETKQKQLMQKRIEHDIKYIKNWNFMLDLKIILKTVKNIVYGEEHVF